jgi:hypothetical protein
LAPTPAIGAKASKVLNETKIVRPVGPFLLELGHFKRTIHNHVGDLGRGSMGRRYPPRPDNRKLDLHQGTLSAHLGEHP